jgi:SAM-dependent methyltransferase
MSQAHWDAVWADRDPEAVTWHQSDPSRSVRLIGAHAGVDAAIVDVGGGASRLIDRLLDAGYRDLTVVDIAAASLDAARRRLGVRGDAVAWVTGDITEIDLDRAFDVWHDRAVFHFLVDATDRRRYLDSVRRSLRPGGHLVLATFGRDGPERCSGLAVRRYDAATAAATLGDELRLVGEELEDHVSPAGAHQQFWYGVFERR